MLLILVHQYTAVHIICVIIYTHIYVTCFCVVFILNMIWAVWSTTFIMLSDTQNKLPDILCYQVFTAHNKYTYILYMLHASYDINIRLYIYVYKLQLSILVIESYENSLSVISILFLEWPLLTRPARPVFSRYFRRFFSNRVSHSKQSSIVIVTRDTLWWAWYFSGRVGTSSYSSWGRLFLPLM